jgi:triacylglycerol lipase
MLEEWWNSQFHQANIGIGHLRQAGDGDHTKRNLPYTLKTPLLSRHGSPTGNTTHPASIASRLAALPASLTTLILGIVDAPAYSDLTTRFCNEIFNPSTPARPGVRYFSVGARQKKMR